MVMDFKSLTIEKILDLNIENKNILIIGCPASGKTWLSDQFKTEHKKIHTDDYKDFGYEQSLYRILDDIKKTEGFSIIEGIQGYRLLRKGVQLNCYYPDIVIQLLVSEKHLIDIYSKERGKNKIKNVKSFIRGLDKILSEYLSLPNKSDFEWIEVFNDHSEQHELTEQYQ